VQTDKKETHNPLVVVMSGGRRVMGPEAIRESRVAIHATEARNDGSDRYTLPGAFFCLTLDFLR
jgi:hypothetical protein